MNSDAPISALYRPLVQLTDGLDSTRVLLCVLTVAGAGLFALGAARLSRRRLELVSLAFVVVVLPGITIYMFERILGHPGWSDRPISELPQPAYDWVDANVGADARVAMAPYPVSSNYFVNQRVWRDYEFWNKSVERDVQQPDQSFLYSGEVFTRLYPHFDRNTGVSSESPAQYVLQANQESRFRVAGTVRAVQDAMLIEAAMPWRLDWISEGLYPDGWTKPATPATVRVFGAPGQKGSVVRTLGLRFRAPESMAENEVVLYTNRDAQSGIARAETLRLVVQLCVPADGHSDVLLSARDVAQIPGDLRTVEGSPDGRLGGVLVTEIALADEIGDRCSEA